MELLPDKSVQAVLQVGIAALQTNQSLVDDLFSSYDSTTRTYIKTFLTSHPNIKVRLGWPRPDVVFPTISIALGSESEGVGQDTLGDLLGEEFSEEPVVPTTNPPTSLDIRSDILGYATDIQLTIMVITGNEDATPFLYQIVKRLLLASKLPLELSGLLNMKISGGDFRFDQEYFPEFAYARALTVSALTYFRMISTTPEYLLTQISLALSVPNNAGTANLPLAPP